jgi:hypothetical protein
MPSPFPGIDPYIESVGLWRDFHGAFLSRVRAMLNRRLPQNYAAVMDDEFRIFEEAEGGKSRGVLFDVAVARTAPTPPGRRAEAEAASGQPAAMLLPEDEDEEEPPLWLEIQHLPDRELVAVLELLSPTNKGGHGRSEYLRKRKLLLKQDIHLIELDFLLSGPRLPMRGTFPEGDFYALVSRVDRRPVCDVYAWSIRQPPPTIAVPLRRPDPDVPLDLAALHASAFDEGGYNRLLRYNAPLALPLAEEDRAWAAERAREAVR